MLLPSIFGENLFDDFFDDFDRPFKAISRYQAPSTSIMKTDIKEVKGGYELNIDLPGYKKDNVKVDLDNGYLTVTASAKEEKEDEDSRFLRRERYYGACSRSFYVGEAIEEKDIKAKFCDGILSLSFPKNEQQKAEQKKYISIE